MMSEDQYFLKEYIVDFLKNISGFQSPKTWILREIF